MKAGVSCGRQDGVPAPGYCRAGALSTQAECRRYTAHCRNGDIAARTADWDAGLLQQLQWDPCAPRSYRGAPGPDPCGCEEGTGWAEVAVGAAARGCAALRLLPCRAAVTAGGGLAGIDRPQ